MGGGRDRNGREEKLRDNNGEDETRNYVKIRKENKIKKILRK